MRQLPFSIHNQDELVAAITTVQRAQVELGTCTGMLVTLYAVPDEAALLQQVQQELARQFPQAVLTGAMTRNQIMNGHILGTGVLAAFTLFSQSQVALYAYALNDLAVEEAGAASSVGAQLADKTDQTVYASEAAGKELLEQVQHTPNVQAIELSGTGSKLALQPFFRWMGRCSAAVQVFGGVADNGDLSEGCLLAGAARITHGVVAVVFSGAALHISVSSSFGWRPLGQQMTVTATADPFTVTEIDHKPAAHIYHANLGIKEGEAFHLDALTFPIFLKRHGLTLARHPFTSERDGSLTFGADIYTGEQIQLAYGDPQAILDRADELMLRMAEFHPQCIFGVSCVARSLLMQGETEKELAMSTFAPSHGFYAYGEFMRHGSEIVVANMTLVMVGMREGEPTAEPLQLPPRISHVDKRTEDMRHLVTFIQTTIAELEEAKNRYRELARTDMLTHLYNRGATEHRLRQMLQEGEQWQEPLALIMMDIDDFKGINDAFGHDAGDRALQGVAGVLKACTRQGIDVPGRMGGDEFFVVLCNTGRTRAADIAERIRAGVGELEALPSGQHFTTSIGVAFARTGDTPNSLLKRADNALYAAKRSQGKDNVSLEP